ncbi:MAG: prolipoprotein diacylglyceryl transferase family protein, partial [candidate division WOR-3 bacterium]
MCPSLRLLPGLAIPSYGLMLFISFVLGTILFDRRARSRGVIPGQLRYTWIWAATDVVMSLIIIGAGIWAILLGPRQVGFLRDRPAAFVAAFRLLVLALVVYLVYGSLVHLIHHLRSKTIEGAEFTTYLALWVLLSAIIGSRLLYVLLHWHEFENDIVSTFAFWRGGLQGLMFYGGLIGALAMGLLFAHLNRIPLLKVLDIAIISIVLGEFFTRIGCFLNGCCFGKACSLPWAVRFPSGSPVAMTDFGHLPIHPTQLYSSLAGLVLFGLALLLDKRRWRH